MEWTEVKIYTEHSGVEALSDALIAAGIDGLMINDPEDIREFERNKNASWDYIGEEVWELCGKDTFVTVYLDKDDPTALETVRGAVDSLRSRDDVGSLEMKFGTVADEDWANSWKRFWKPMEIGERLLITPSWEEVPAGTGRVNITLDPENSFGTGRHHTTRLCLELLEKYIKPGDTICDLGAGSGIISIAGMLLGGASATAVDISADAAKTSQENARKNGIPDERYTALCGDVTTDRSLVSKITRDGGYTLVTANIVADVLIAMAYVFKKLIAFDGILILSGIIDNRKDEVFEVMKSYGFELIEERNCEMWNAAVFID
ncbi:MAG: 50S ribosomal protein L11 methyltransferase [Oscillospiraceae bacterium]|nr:50S ribosomal protein L11 methyltransferase [Ruminococcus sp.]MCD8344933.1 50S ribosomal protein L11 methyltransferase [Oscillospiraceae bacterium]